jgi:hypothetical protein
LPPASSTVTAAWWLAVPTPCANLKTVKSDGSGTEEATTAIDDDTPETFDPFTEKPVEGVHYRFEPGPVSRLAYQNPRTYYFSFGVRF